MWNLGKVSHALDSRGYLNTTSRNKTSNFFDLYFLRSVGAPTTLAETAVVDAYTLTLTDATGFVDGTYVGLSWSGGPRYYFGTQIGAASGNTITLDTPLDLAFPAGANVINTSRELNVDGSVTPVTFSIQSGEASTLEVDVTRIMFAMILSTAGDDGYFGNIARLTRGCVLRLTDGTCKNFWNVKSNGEIGNLAYDVAYPVRSGGLGSYGMRARYTLNGPDKHDRVVRVYAGDRLDFIVQDDLTAINRFRLIASGAEACEA